MSFRALHVAGDAFIMPNPWDVGGARLLAGLGFPALATTSAGVAFADGRRDGAVTVPEALENARRIREATGLPVNADLENGLGHSPEDAAETIRLAAEIVDGCSLEDFTGDASAPIYDRSLATERIAAAAEACAAAPGDLVFTARCENFLHGRPDLDDTIERLVAYQDAGADVLYAPGLTDLSAIRAVCDAVDRPVNVIMGFSGCSFGQAELRDAGVARISVGSALSRHVFAAIERAGREMIEEGSFRFGDDAIGFGALEAYFPPLET